MSAGHQMNAAMGMSTSPRSAVHSLGQDNRGPRTVDDRDQKSICAPSFTKRGVRTDCGASQACEPVVTAGLKFWL